MMLTKSCFQVPQPGAFRKADGAIDLDRANACLSNCTPEEILTWAAGTFGGRICLQSSMQRRSSTLMHMLSDLGLRSIPALFVDTG
ncbi:MAG: hypothetical protein KC561_13280, partial [Myxococcales bacterium]|nr:hypothetical protein [Myxococcales bacterium]